MIEISRRNIYQKGNILLTIFSLSVIFVLGSVFRPPVIFLTAPIRYHILEWGFESMILKFKRFCAIKMPCPGMTSFWPKCDLLFILNAKTLQFTMNTRSEQRFYFGVLSNWENVIKMRAPFLVPILPEGRKAALNLMKISQFDENFPIW